MGTLRISVDDSGMVAATSAKLHVVVKGTAAVFGNAAVKRAAEVRDLVSTLSQRGVAEDQIEVNGVHIATSSGGLGRHQRAEISLSIRLEAEQLPDVLGVLTDAPNLTVADIEWVFDTFEASIPMTAAAMVKARRKADAIAAAVDQRITGILNASDSWSTASPRPMAMAYAAADSARSMKSSAPLDLGVDYTSSTELSVHVSVDFEMTPIASADSPVADSATA